MFVERFGLIVAVDVKEDAAGFGVEPHNQADGSVEERATQVVALKAGQHIDLLQLVDIDA